MEGRPLSDQEANQLLERTLILISQQNLAEKQKSQKGHSQSQPGSPTLPPAFHRKASLGTSNLQSIELPTLYPILSSELSPTKPTVSTSHKISLESQEGALSGGSSSISSPRKPREGEGMLEEKPEVKVERAQMGRRMMQEEEAEEGGERCQGGEGKEGRLVVQSGIKDVKRDLEIVSRGKVCKSQEVDSKTGQIVGYHFTCKSDADCPFDCFLEYTGQRTPSNDKLYRLRVSCDSHLKSCLEDEEEVNFIRMTRRIDEMQEAIAGLLSQDGQRKPKDILTLMGQRLDESPSQLIYHGLKSKSYHKAAKKYFDNLIYKVKTQLGLF